MSETIGFTTGTFGFDCRRLLGDFLSRRGEELAEFRRLLHRHPETAYREDLTTARIFDTLRRAGLWPERLPHGTGLICDIGSADTGLVALRADIDALPVEDLKDVPYRSHVKGVAHACGHDVHAAVVLGVGLFLAELVEKGLFRGGVRLIFQPAEEAASLGAKKVIEARGLADVKRVFALHCDPSLRVGRIGLIPGPITSSYDLVRVRLTGPGGHTARPHLTGDLIMAQAKVALDLPALLAQRTDVRANHVFAWSRSAAGTADNAIPENGHLTGVLRCASPDTREQAGTKISQWAPRLAAPYGVEAAVEIERLIPPAVNDGTSVEILRGAVQEALGEGAAVPTEQSLGGEDFAFYLEKVPGALARLGVAAPGKEGLCDLHRGDFDIDWDAIPGGVRVLTHTALRALAA